MAPRFKAARFHASTGPASLFERVWFVMRAKKNLKVHAEHLLERTAARDAPLELLRTFDPDKWELMTVEVRTDTGKFVNSAWRVRAGDRLWWIVVGLHDAIETVIEVDEWKRGRGKAVVTGGDLYEFVAQVNHGLMLRDTGQSG